MVIKMNLYIVRPFHRPIYKIVCADKVLLTSLRLQYGKYINDTKTQLFELFKTTSSEIYEIEIAPHDSQNYIVRHGGNYIITPYPLLELKNLCFEITTYDESVLALHGAAVEWNGTAYIFLAATGNGKTTLTSYLTSTGFGYITDDCVLLDREDFKVHAYNCPIHLREGGFDVLKQLNIAPNITGESMERFIYIPENLITNPLPLGGVFFIELSNTDNILSKPKSKEIVVELMRSPITKYKATSYYHKTLIRLAQMPCWKLVYKDMNFVADTIKSI